MEQASRIEFQNIQKKNDSVMHFTIQLCGNTSVGKTSLLHRLIYDNFLDKSVATLGTNYYQKCYNIQGEVVKVTINDTSGQERYFDITKQSVRKADALILIYDMTDFSSFNDLQKFWLSQLDDYIDLPSIPMILIGNKQDKYPCSVGFDQGDQLARSYNMSFFETSALTGQSVKNAFDSLIYKLYLLKKKNYKIESHEISLHESKSYKQKNDSRCC